MCQLYISLVCSPLPDVNDASSTAANSEETATNNGDADTPASSTANVVVNGTPPPDTGWSIVCSTQEEWEGLIDSLQGSRQLEPRRLHHTLADLLPSIEGLLEVRSCGLARAKIVSCPDPTPHEVTIRHPARPLRGVTRPLFLLVRGGVWVRD